ncbi:hypothetical protein NEPAR04_0090 [Nematocida parisii]|nr:hypothetical protein NEPAR08_0370 [Nematocida parisii]KAI5127166.1 hypothetical protein NEPAR03_0833 [Nematocida parisii]KAI5140116.1 hypothetical protein NEPAR04_0090 [Nematocida parisii]
MDRLVYRVNNDSVKSLCDNVFDSLTDLSCSDLSNPVIILGLLKKIDFYILEPANYILKYTKGHPSQNEITLVENTTDDELNIKNYKSLYLFILLNAVRKKLTETIINTHSVINKELHEYFIIKNKIKHSTEYNTHSVISTELNLKKENVLKIIKEELLSALNISYNDHKVKSTGNENIIITSTEDNTHSVISDSNIEHNTHSVINNEDILTTEDNTHSVISDSNIEHNTHSVTSDSTMPSALLNMHNTESDSTASCTEYITHSPITSGTNTESEYIMPIEVDDSYFEEKKQKTTKNEELLKKENINLIIHKNNGKTKNTIKNTDNEIIIFLLLVIMFILISSAYICRETLFGYIRPTYYIFE